MIVSPLLAAIVVAIILAIIVVVLLRSRSSSAPALPVARDSAAAAVDKPVKAVLSIPPRPETLSSLYSIEDDEDPEDLSGPHERILVTAAGMTDPGLKRRHNEDAYIMVPEQNMFAIADGMGMHAAGEVASKLTIEAIAEAFQEKMFTDPADPEARRNRKKRLLKIVERANQIVLAMANEIDAYRGMGTTLVIAWFSPSKQKVHIASVGDSRCYRLRGEEIMQLTVDHTFGAIGIATGKSGGILARAVGIEENIEVDVTVDHPEVGDIYLLCSDGLSRMTTDQKILETVRAKDSLDDATRGLMDLAISSGGRDNVTIILVRVDPGEPS